MNKQNVWQDKYVRSKPQWARQPQNQAAVKRSVPRVKPHANKSGSFTARCASRPVLWLVWLQVGWVALVWLAVGLMLTGCASGTSPILAQPRPCPASLTVACPTPPPARSGSLADLLDNHIEAMELAAQCRDQLAKLARCVRE